MAALSLLQLFRGDRSTVSERRRLRRRPGSLTVSFNPFGRDPNDLTNATGILPNDRTHMLRAQGGVEIPGVEILVGSNFQYLTGTPYTGLANVTLPQGVRPIYIEPFGSRRLSSQ